MNTNQIKEKIAEIIRAAEKRNLVNYELQGEHSLSLSYPEGQAAYFKKKIFELKQQIKDQSLIGKHWIENYCKPDIFGSDWLQKHTEILLDPKFKFNENEAFRQLKLFIDQCIQLSNYENIIRESESEKKTETPEIINSEYTVKSVLMAYYYMHRKEIYLISELQGTWVLKNIHEKLHQMYGFSTNSFKNDWNPIFKNGEKNPENIRLAIKLLRTFDDPRIKESIELANSELNEAELKS